MKSHCAREHVSTLVAEFARVWRSTLLAAASMLGAAGGCGETVVTTTVSGNVTVAGAPLPGGAVQFFARGGGRPIHAAIDDNGNYRAEVPPGEYAVAIVGSVELPDGWKEGDPIPTPPITVPAKYAHPKRSPLSVVVGASPEMKKDFELE